MQNALIVLNNKISPWNQQLQKKATHIYVWSWQCSWLLNLQESMWYYSACVSLFFQLQKQFSTLDAQF